jgi:hypothetical protein
VRDLNYQSGLDRKYERTGVLRKLFGPSQNEIWQHVAAGVGGQFDPTRWTGRGGKVTVEVGEWTLTLDTYTVSNGKSSTTFTRMRAPYVNRDGFRFVIYRAGLFTPLGKMLGMQDIEIGQPPFDRDFVLKSSNPPQLRRILADPALRQMISAHPRIQLEVKDDEGWFGAKFPDGVDELCFTSLGVIKDIELLHNLFDLFAHALNRLCHIGSAYEDDPGIEL